MNRAISAISISLLTTLAPAQTVSYESVRLADVFAESSWQSLEQALPPMLSVIENQLRAGGATEKASKVFIVELRRSMTRDGVTKAVAQVLSKRMNQDELKELSTFLQSSVGKKYLQVSRDLSTDPVYVAPMFKQACEASARQLSETERGSISGTCSQF